MPILRYGIFAYLFVYSLAILCYLPTRPANSSLKQVTFTKLARSVEILFISVLTFMQNPCIIGIVPREQPKPSVPFEEGKDIEPKILEKD